ncbi:hypothetical protein niasHS_015962 [Heterodera schachtii]|uniref:Macro domain-containing protein n=2 Tax=Heterodera TaxID=34509 RepID=A0ABD2I0T4_HETSC
MAKNQRSLFRGKVIVCRESIEEVNSDCFINFSCPNILSGTESFKRIHDLAGPELAHECEKFLHIFPTSSRVTSSFLATNFKFIVHTVVPNPLDFTRLIDMKKVYICIRNSLELAVEEGAKTIAFPCHFPGLSPRVACELILRIFTVWIHRCKYSDELTEIKITCDFEPIFHQFVQSARSLYEEANTIGHKFVPAFAQQHAAYIHNRTKMDRPRRNRLRRLYEFPPPDAPQVRLELSAKLAPTILVLDDEHGMKRQYRLTNRSRDGRKLYFRCSRCDTLIKKDGHQFGIRAKLIVEDGHIVSERFPQHHPLCVPKPLEEVLVQQVDRTSRREVKDGYLLPQDAYRKALDRMRFEARQLGMAVEECFPDWPKLRQQYCRIRKQAVRERMQRNWEMMVMMHGGERMIDEDYDGQEQYYDGADFSYGRQLQQKHRMPPDIDMDVDVEDDGDGNLR